MCANFLSSLIICAIFFFESDYLCEIFVESDYEDFCEMSVESKYVCYILCRFCVSLLASAVFKNLTQNTYLGCESVLRNTSIIPPQFKFTFVHKKNAASSSRRPVAWWC